MEEILILGHKNPDTDSMCAVYSYAKYKNITDRKSKYIPARCGGINNQTKFIFNKLNIAFPVLYKDIYLKANDVMTKEVYTKKEDEPLFEALHSLEKQKIRIVPIVTGENKFAGIISIFELASFFIPKNLKELPKYIISLDYFDRIFKGSFIKRSNKGILECIISVGAMPYEDFIKVMETKENLPVLLVLGNRRELIDYAVKKEFPCIIVTGIEEEKNLNLDLSNYKGSFFITPLETYDVLRLLTYTVPCKYVMNKKVPVVYPDVYLKEAKNMILNSENRALLVINEDNNLMGILTRSDILQSKPKKVILVDHNEFSQAVDGIETAEIVEIIDHHRIGDIKTKNPINILAKPVGSSCTIIYGLYKSTSVPLDKTIALVLLSGILSDTILLKSPTTTDEDVRAVEEISMMTGFDYKKWGEEIFSQTVILKEESIKELILSDFKLYYEGDIRFGIGQLEVVNFSEVNAMKESIIKNLYEIQRDKSLDWVMVMVSNIVTGHSVLYTTEFKQVEQLLAYKKVGKNEYYLENTISRKKQLLPEILNILEQLYSI
jgi:manganese-dependent inorganic pyrophosphatase